MWRDENTKIGTTMIEVRKTVLFGAAAVLALGLVATPVSFDGNGFGIETAAAAGKGGGMKDECYPTKKQKGNNGWGNGGGDGINPGSDEGATAGTKFPDQDR
jgi:hypothetical protein